jgi:hypothetical protein
MHLSGDNLQRLAVEHEVIAVNADMVRLRCRSGLSADKWGDQ